MFSHQNLSNKELRAIIKAKTIRFGGNQKLRIYGRLDCTSGKKMKRENRVFFLSEEEALQKNFRPCGQCMRTRYNLWKNGLI